MQKSLVRKGFVLGIICLFIGASIITTGSLQTENDKNLFCKFDDWWDSDWQFRKQISINHSLVDNDLQIQERL